ncbi:hypothetical protein R1flu_018451 [Riccia fluitans]|uniref:Prolyl 4-hydroxylase alpha subunit Fe(2+) 2OG dioxygenase domain-containing protein n=1 Tax=Riccia fluitans TaxID=41844 RepID=A0ABD1ZFV8_9MARC
MGVASIETLVDLKVRRTWQLDPKRVSFEDTKWSDGLAVLTTQIAKRLGCAGVDLDVHLYKFLLYEPGGHFAKHRDTEKHHRMFATLVVQLPSIHKGGELSVFKQDVESVYDFGQRTGQASHACHCAVHYADAEHAVKPIFEGYRLVLIYSICWPTTAQEVHQF